MAKISYTIFIGILFAAVVIVGISTFYPSPKFPEYPRSLQFSSPEEVKDSEELRKEQEEFDKTNSNFMEKQELYAVNLSAISLGFSLLLLISGIMSLNKLTFISEGLMVGGVIVLLFGFMSSFMVGPGSATNINIFRFIVVLIGLVASLALGYLKLKPAK